MSSILTRSPWPLWAYILIIAVGSTIILIGLILIIRWRFRRSKPHEAPQDTETAERRFTLRRGRLVPASNYLSLTGSTFGLWNVLGLEERENASALRNRSRSPFEWLSTIIDRSNSRQSEATQVALPRPPHRTQSQSSELSRVTDPEKNAAAQMSLSPAKLNEKRAWPTIEEDVSDETRTSPIVRPSRSTNFSRSFVSQGQKVDSLTSSPTWPQNTFSRVSGTSPNDKIPSRPHTAGAVPSRTVQGSRESLPNRSPGLAGERIQHQRQQQQPFPGPPSAGFSEFVAPIPSIDDEPRVPIPSPSDHDNMWPQSPVSIPRRAASRPDSPRRDSGIATSPEIRHTRSAPYHTRVSSTGTVQHDLRSSYRLDQNIDYWTTRPDLQPVRQPSKKGNVLRKKSCRRASVVAIVDP